MSDITVRQGQTFELPVKVDDASATDVTLDVWNEDGTIITATANFVNKEATIEGGVIVDEVGDYSALVTINYSDGAIDILPLQTGCSDGNPCKFLTFQICEGLPETS